MGYYLRFDEILILTFMGSLAQKVGSILSSTKGVSGRRTERSGRDGARVSRRTRHMRLRARGGPRRAANTSYHISIATAALLHAQPALAAVVYRMAPVCSPRRSSPPRSCVLHASRRAIARESLQLQGSATCHGGTAPRTSARLAHGMVGSFRDRCRPCRVRHASFWRAQLSRHDTGAHGRCKSKRHPLEHARPSSISIRQI